MDNIQAGIDLANQWTRNGKSVEQISAQLKPLGHSESMALSIARAAVAKSSGSPDDVQYSVSPPSARQELHKPGLVWGGALLLWFAAAFAIVLQQGNYPSGPTAQTLPFMVGAMVVPLALTALGGGFAWVMSRSRLTSPGQRAIAFLSGVGLVFGILYAGAVQTSKLRVQPLAAPTAVAPITTAPQKSAASLPKQPDQHSLNTAASDDEVFDQLLRRHPELDPKSSRYQPALANQAQAIFERRLSEGFLRSVAAQQAVNELERRGAFNPPPPTQITYPNQSGNQIKPRGINTPAPEKRPCEYKAVMSDDDYRACGANPPQ